MAKRPSTVEVVARYHVSPPPNSAPPTSLPLTFFDIPWLCFSASQPLFFYKYPFPTNHFLSTTLPTLVHSLSLTLQHFFALAGSLVWPPDPFKPLIVYNEGNYVSLVVAESDGDFFHFSGNHQRCVNEFYPLLPQLPSRASESKHEIPLLAAQITIFSNSGICIGFAYHHVVADGRTFNSFIKTWASLFRDPSFLIKSLPFYDRTVVKDTCGLESIFLNDWSNRKSSQEMAIGVDTRVTNLSDSDMVRATFLMCPGDMEKIKQWIVTQCKLKNNPQPPYLTPSNLTCAFVWICLIKAQEKVNGKLFGKNPSYFGFNAGGITRLDYPVPTTYFGNCIAFARTMAIQRELCGEDGIIVAANMIGNRVKELDDGVLAGAETWISDWAVFYESESHVMVTGSPKLDFYDTDFGWGRPKKIEEISNDKANAISFTESRDVKGGIECFGCLLKEIQIYLLTMAASKAFAAVLVIAMLSAMASAQDFGAAPAPSPSMDKGAAYSLGMSGAAICSSLLLSALALLRQ
ncbi:Malonyl CoA:flavonoid malonyltransferase 5, putative [Theobroma cacao]|uniref:Malonyl CoA:flavonoid malonyltransferase 5, putative n=1 Tax=Theobroma cacao TaxID=3641 RepID=A0A061DXD1_THECC|nr:Malonyl CoA:flavonoid malonyltransferase 5, putative [Theobroma cacao]